MVRSNYRKSAFCPLKHNQLIFIHRSFELFFEGYNIRSSLVASRAKHGEMLQFAVSHDVKPWIEEFERSEAGIAEVVEKLNANKLRYRGVLVSK